jgi:hypothetical protein
MRADKCSSLILKIDSLGGTLTLRSPTTERARAERSREWVITWPIFIPARVGRRPMTTPPGNTLFAAGFGSDTVARGAMRQVQ